MRRPAPLPTPAEQESEPIASEPRRIGRSTRASRADRRGDETSAASSAPVVEQDADPGVDTVDDAETLTTSRDVWRAARARRKALRAEIRRFTQRSRRRRMIWLGSLGALVLLIGGSLIAAYSPLFAVEKITVVGASALDPATIEAALADQIGTPLASVDASEVKAALLAFPLIETYAIEARPPHDLTIRIVERTPVGVVSSGAGYTLVDAAGVALATTAQRPEGQPLIEAEGGTGSPAFESVGHVMRSVPADIRATVTEVRATTPDDVTLTLASGVTVIWGSAEKSVEKARILTGLMKAKPDARTFDVSSSTTGVVR